MPNLVDLLYHIKNSSTGLEPNLVFLARLFLGFLCFVAFILNSGVRWRSLAEEQEVITVQLPDRNSAPFRLRPYLQQLYLSEYFSVWSGSSLCSSQRYHLLVSLQVWATASPWTGWTQHKRRWPFGRRWCLLPMSGLRGCCHYAHWQGGKSWNNLLCVLEQGWTCLLDIGNFPPRGDRDHGAGNRKVSKAVHGQHFGDVKC